MRDNQCVLMLFHAPPRHLFDVLLTILSRPPSTLSQEEQLSNGTRAPGPDSIDPGPRVTFRSSGRVIMNTVKLFTMLLAAAFGAGMNLDLQAQEDQSLSPFVGSLVRPLQKRSGKLEQ